MKPKTSISERSSSDERVPRQERLALRAEIARLHGLGSSDYQLASAFKVSPGAVNKARLHGQLGRRVATAIYSATDTTPELIMAMHPPRPTPGCLICEDRQANLGDADELSVLRLCAAHTIELKKAFGCD